MKTLKKRIITSFMTLVMVLSILSINLVSPEMAFAKVNTAYKERVSTAIKKTSRTVVKTHNSWDWAAIGLARAGKQKVNTGKLFTTGKRLHRRE